VVHSTFSITYVDVQNNNYKLVNIIQMKTKIVSELKKGLGFQHSSGVVAAQEQARIFIKCSQVNNVNLQELREALNTKWNVDILKPRDGIGGDCLPKDTKMFLQSSQSSGKSKILTSALKVDQNYGRYRFVEAWPTCR
jgi:UDP-N-acetyl-D-mannosaminuronic acid dehydrogenase